MFSGTIATVLALAVLGPAAFLPVVDHLPAMLALGVTLFPFNTHLAVYSAFWGGITLLLAALYAGSLLSRETGS